MIFCFPSTLVLSRRNINWKFDFSPETSAVCGQCRCFLSCWPTPIHENASSQNLHMMGDSLCRYFRWDDAGDVAIKYLVGAKRARLA